MLLDLHRKRVKPRGARLRQDQRPRELAQVSRAGRRRGPVRRKDDVRADDQGEPQHHRAEDRDHGKGARPVSLPVGSGAGPRGVEVEQRRCQSQQCRSTEPDAVHHGPDTAFREQHGTSCRSGQTRASRTRGSATVTCSPLPVGGASNCILPRCNSRIRCTIDRSSPLPGACVPGAR